MRVMIAGSAGLVGSSLARACAGGDVIALGHRDLDITDSDAVQQMVSRLRPDVIFNCAVIGVDLCETDPALAERVNVTGPASLAAAAEGIGATIVHFSSNYVFDGRRTSGLPYAVEDEALPINVYGVTKLRGERAVAAASDRALVVRTSWVFGPGKQTFLATVPARLRRGEPIAAISDSFASTTFVNDLVARVMDLVARGERGTHHVANEGVCSHETFAREAARLLGLSEEATDRLVEPTLEASMARAAPRPRWTPMRCEPPLRSWEEALAEYVGAERPM
jgi:dTDP-4-dehydrorhamnose reductase